jgi:hypothetical protein
MAPEQSDSWWKTLPGMLTATAGLITAVAGLLAVLVQAGVLGADSSDESSQQAVSPPVQSSSPVVSSPPGGGATSTTAGAASTLTELEAQLAAANIQLGGSSEDIAKVKGYMADPNGAYWQLARASVDLLAGRRLRLTGYLDMIDKWYTIRVGQSNYLTGAGTLDLEQLKAAMVLAQAEIHDVQARTFEEILETP